MSVINPISKSLFHGGIFSGLNGGDDISGTYNLYVDFKPGVVPKDKVSKQPMQTTGLAAGRVSYDGGPYGVNEPAIDGNGLFGCGVIENLVPDPEDTSLWSGTGPWTNTVTVGTGTHTLSTDLDGATVSITAGTATIDGTASATYGNPDNFEVTGAGTVTIQTDTADPKAQVTATVYKLPYVDGLSPENYSDADQGYKFPISGLPDLDDDDGWMADGDELVVNGDFSDSGVGNAVAVSGSLISNITNQLNIFPNNSIGYHRAEWASDYSAGDYVEISCNVISISGSNRFVDVSHNKSYALTETGRFLKRIVVGDALPKFGFGALSDTMASLIIDDVSIKKISPAKAFTTCQQNLTDAFDGVADRNELIVNGDFSNVESTDSSVNPLSGWGNDGTHNDNNKFTISNKRCRCVSDGTFNSITQNGIVSLGNEYEVTFYVYDVTSGGITVRDTSGDLYTATKSGSHKFRFVSAGLLLNIKRYAGITDVTFSNVSVKQVSPAQGKLTCEWRPMFDSGDLTGTINILTANDEAGSFIFFDADNDLLKLTDGTNTSQVACSPVADTVYEITSQWDETNGMVISLNGTAGTTVSFAGSIPNADDLSYYWEAEAPQYVKITHIAKESGL